MITTGATENTVKNASAAACTKTWASSHSFTVVRITADQYCRIDGRASVMAAC